MTPIEWYSGSDGSGKVPSAIEEVSNLLDQEVPDLAASHLEMLKCAIEIEEEPNWVGFLTGLAGMVLEALGRSDEAGIAYEAVATFSRPDLETFDDTLNVFCQANYRLGKMLLEAKHYEGALEAFFRVVPYMTLIFEDEHRCTVASFVDHCFSELDRPRFALPFAEAAAYFRPDDDLVIELLAQAYDANRLMWKAEAVRKRTDEQDAP